MFGNALKRILGLDHPQSAKRTQPVKAPLPYAQYMNQDGTGGGYGPSNPSPIQLGGPVQSVEGFSPQDTYGVSELDTGNYLQPSYRNPQNTLISQSNSNLPSAYGGPNPNQQPNYAADPYGWLRQQLRF